MGFFFPNTTFINENTEQGEGDTSASKPKGIYGDDLSPEDRDRRGPKRQERA
jgi:hypothetical protein